jgi:hypothetical protein
MRNARKEFEEHVAGLVVKCAKVYLDSYSSITIPKLLLPLGYTENQCTEFLSRLAFEYDSGYGSQELFGTIWYTDGSWSERGEYDGSEWWEHNTFPEIPECLKGELK